MINRKFISVVWSIIIMTVLVTCGNSKDNIVDIQSGNIEPVFVIYDDVKMYSDGDSINEKQKLNYLDLLIIISKEINNKGRIKVKLQNGTEGWIEEKYISLIPANWGKKELKDDYYFYADKNILFKKKETKDKQVSDYQFNDSNYNMNLQINNSKNFNGAVESIAFIIKSELEAGSEKKFNWSRKFSHNNYNVNFVITTFDPQGNITESLDFCKKNELDSQKYFSFWITYHPSISLEKLLIQRKILLSAFQSLQ